MVHLYFAVAALAPRARVYIYVSIPENFKLRRHWNQLAENKVHDVNRVSLIISLRGRGYLRLSSYLTSRQTHVIFILYFHLPSSRMLSLGILLVVDESFAHFGSFGRRGGYQNPC